jgi:Tol biopolymer transport system component
VLDDVQDADWAPNGVDMAVVRYLPANAHWRLEYPVGKVLLDTVNWISELRISPDGKSVAFSHHQNSRGDDEGGVAVIGPDGKEKILANGYSSIQGILWSPKGDEVWFTASESGSLTTAHAATLAGKLRILATWPQLMWFEDWHDGSALVVAHKHRNNIRALAPGAKEERELGWFGWSTMPDATPDLKKIVFEEEAEGGGPNYTVFLRDTDGSPPIQLGEGVAVAISPDEKWVVTKPAKGGPLSLVPTGAGEARQLTHDDVDISDAHFLPDGKQLLAVGIEPGHGVRDYLIDVATGNLHPVTPEGVRGDVLSWDGDKVAVFTPEAKQEIWSLSGAAPQPIPGLDTPSDAYVTGWSADGKSVYVLVSQGEKPGVYLESLADGKRTFWKTNAELGTAGVGSPGYGWFISKDGKSYAYGYARILSEAYLVMGLK